jgi:acetyl esterase/lipase
MNITKILLLCTMLSPLASVFASVKVAKNINYTNTSDESRQLNIYYPGNTEISKDVLIFINGGSWSSGKKETYWWLGRNFARKGVVTVNINYGLAPQNQFGQMADDCAASVKWVKDHITAYGGNPARIFVMGHSAGGHLAELINADPRYFKKAGIVNPVKGVILNDAFGLDMKAYLLAAEKDNRYYDFLRTFSTSPDTWEMGSPLHYFQYSRNPHLVFYGGDTYPAIQLQSEEIVKRFQSAKVPVSLKIIKGKKHVGMISQMVFGSNQLYDDILHFIKAN